MTTAKGTLLFYFWHCYFVLESCCFVYLFYLVLYGVPCGIIYFERLASEDEHQAQWLANQLVLSR